MPNDGNSFGDNLADAVDFHLDRFLTALDGDTANNLYANVSDVVDKAIFERVLRYTRGNQLKAAELLGLNRNTLRQKLNNLDLDPKNYKARSKKK